MGGGVAGDVAAVHADTAPGEAHPVGHFGALEATAFGDGIAGVCVGAVDVALGIVDGAVEVGGFAGADFLKNGVVAGGSGVGGLAGGNWVVHGQFVSFVEHGALQAEVDGDAGGTAALQDGLVFVDLVGLRVGGVGLEVLVGSGGVRIDEDGGDFLGLLRVGGGRAAGAAGDQTGEEGKEEAGVWEGHEGADGLLGAKLYLFSSLSQGRGCLEQLACRAPGGGAAGDGGPGEGFFACGAGSAGFPAVLKKPGGGRDEVDVGAGGEGYSAGAGEGEIAVGDVPEGAPADGAGGCAEGGGVEFADRGGGVGGEAPADLVGHPVADAGEGGLVEEEGLEGDAGAAVEEGGEVAESEGAVEDLRGEVGPRVGVAVEFESTELPVVVVGEGVVGGAEEEVVVLPGAVVGGGGVEAAGHA